MIAAFTPFAHDPQVIPFTASFVRVPSTSVMSVGASAFLVQLEAVQSALFGQAKATDNAAEAKKTIAVRNMVSPGMTQVEFDCRTALLDTCGFGQIEDRR